MTLYIPKTLPGTENEEIERHATWLEIFFDLVFAIIVTQLSNRLSGNLNFHGVWQCSFLLLPLMWTWASYTVFAARFDNNDFVHWVLTFVIMFAAIIMAIQIPHALENGSAGFTAGFLIGQVAILILYFRVRTGGLLSRQISRFYLSGFGTAGSVWFISLFTGPPYRYVLWVFGISIYLVIPWIGRQKILAKAPLNVTYIPERLGAFTTIILGQIIASVVFGLESANWDYLSMLAGILAFVLVIIVFLQYYRFIQIADYKYTLKSGQPYIYTHIPLVISLIIMGTCVEEFIKHPLVVHTDATVVLFIATITWMISFTLLQYITIQKFKIRALIFASGMIALLLLFSVNFLPSIVMLICLDIIFTVLFSLQYLAGKHHLSVHKH